MTNTSARNRQSAGQPTGGQFATEAKSADTGVELGGGGTALDTSANDRAFDAAIDKHVASGLLQQRQDWPDGERWETGDILIGHTDAGYRVYAGMSVSRHTDKPRRTVDLHATDGSREVGIVFSVVEKGHRKPFMSGRNLPGVAEMAGPELNAVAASHLNDMNAGTRKQNAEAKRLLASGEARDAGDLLDQIEPDNGYRYGSDWLYEPIDASVASNGLDRLAEHAKAKDARPAWSNR